MGPGRPQSLPEHTHVWVLSPQLAGLRSCLLGGDWEAWSKSGQ